MLIKLKITMIASACLVVFAGGCKTSSTSTSALNASKDIGLNLEANDHQNGASLEANVPFDPYWNIAGKDSLSLDSMNEGIPLENEIALNENGEEETEPSLNPEDLEEGFCRDDIYANFLKQKWYAQNPKVKALAIAKAPKRRGSKTSRRTRELRDYDAREMAALYWVKTHMAGEMVPYYGGIPVVANARVEFWMRYFKTAGRKQFMRWLVRGESVREVVYPVLRNQGLPPELFFLAMIESGFSNRAYSSAKATGAWQFMSGTAKIYGLKIDYWVDERRDPIKSTVAAARFMRDLYEEFGDWYLAMAAYNAGPGRIKRAIRSTGRHDFWSLADIPNAISTETRHYVPKVLAALILASNPRAHGFEVQQDPLDVMPTTSVTLDRPIRLDEVAWKLRLPLRIVQQWNPELVQNIAPLRHGRGYDLRLPETLLPKFQTIASELSMIEIADVQMHKVRVGDTLAKIAQRYKVRIKQILSVNPQLSPGKLRVGREIAVPIPGIVTKAKPVSPRAA